jgi:hypothetical protein
MRRDPNPAASARFRSLSGGFRAEIAGQAKGQPFRWPAMTAFVSALFSSHCPGMAPLR